jgi:hypothetical protein
MTMFVIGAVLFVWGWCLVATFSRPDPGKMSILQAKKVEEEAKAKRTPGRIAAAILLILLGMGLALGGIFGSSGTGRCNAQGQCQQLPGTPYTP